MESPQRIVSLLSSATEILFGIGVGDRVVAVSHECDCPSAIANLPRVTRSLIEATVPSDEIDQQVRELSSTGTPLYQLDGDQIGRLQPQLIVTQSQCDVCAVSLDQVQSLATTDQRLARTEILSLNPNSLSDVFADVIRIGRAVHAEIAAAEFVAKLRQRVEAIAGRTANLLLTARPRTLCIEWIEPLMLAANWTPELIELAGGHNGLTRSGKHSTYANLV